MYTSKKDPKFKWNRSFLALALMSLSLGLWAQFPGAAGSPNSTAIHKDSHIFSAWATQCTINRGWLNILDKGAGKTSVGKPESALGRPGQNGIVSLGDSGVAIVQFEQPIQNGPGADFAIFENSFSDFFLELAFVEVSSNGKDWVRFPATCNLSQDTQIGAFDETSDPTRLNNLAGKYRAQYGTPFDLEELSDSAQLNMDSIVYIKVIDAVGTVGAKHSQKDAQGNKVNDPFPTPFASGGFDLDAIGVIHQNVVSSLSPVTQTPVVFPNPIASGGKISVAGFFNQGEVTMCNVYGQIWELREEGVIAGYSQFHLPRVTPGIYTIVIQSKGALFTRRIVMTP